MIEYIKNRQKVIQETVKNFYTKSGLLVYIKDPFLNDEINLEKAIKRVESRIPKHLQTNVEMLIVSNMDEFNERDIKGFYRDSAIYLNPDQMNNEELIHHLLHEYSHSVEEQFGEEIYDDMLIQNEFLSKRENLYNILWKMGHRANLKTFLNIEYNEEFDEFLYQTIGYDKLLPIINGIFLNPYSATDLGEYFGTGFTEYFLYPDRHEYMKNTCPKLYNKIKFIARSKNFD